MWRSKKQNRTQIKSLIYSIFFLPNPHQNHSQLTTHWVLVKTTFLRLKIIPYNVEVTPCKRFSQVHVIQINKIKTL